MTDYMKEAERLLADVVRAATMTDCHGVQADIVYRESRAALLAHIQRGAVPEGWQVVPSADQLWNNDEVMALNAELGLTMDQLSRLASAITRIAHPADWRERFSQAVYDDLAAADNQDFPLEEYPARILKVLDAVIGREIKPAPAPDHLRDAAEMVPVYCTPTEHEGRIVYEHTSEPIPNADGFVLYAAPAAPSAQCLTCSGHGMIGGLLPNGGGYESHPCPDCAAPAAPDHSATVQAEVPMPESVGGTFIDGLYYHKLYSKSLMQQYGDAREAAGYARGRADSLEGGV